MHAHGARHLQPRIEAWIRAGCEGLVQALATETGIPGNLCHAGGTGNVAQGGEQQVGIFVLENRRIDLDDALAAKMKLNAERYPVEKSRGKNLKYGDL